MLHLWTKSWHYARKRKILVFPAILLIVLLIVLGAACGSGTTTNTASTGIAIPRAADYSNNASGSASTQAQSAAASVNQAQAGKVPSLTNNTASVHSKQAPSTSQIGSRYLIKSLKVSMQVKDTLATANDLQAWINSVDPQSSSAGTDYEQDGNNLYNVTLTFSVQATLYPQIYHYLQNYSAKKGGQLTSFNESIQDVTSDYVDTNARLENLRTERDRILTLMKQAQSMSDIITIEGRLTDVEGQIESIQAHLNQLKDQVTYYNITITLQPIDAATPPPPTPGWSVGQVFHDAFAASIAFAQNLATLLIWIVAFSLYLIPLLLIALCVKIVRQRWQRSVPRPKVDATSGAEPVAATEPTEPISVPTTTTPLTASSEELEEQEKAVEAPSVNV